MTRDRANPRTATGEQAAERCDDFGWMPRGPIDQALVADTVQHPRFGIGRAWSRFAGYELASSPALAYLVYTVEGGFEFAVGGETVVTDPGTLLLLDGAVPVTTRTVAETARFVWYLTPTILRAGRSRFRYGEPVRLENAPLRALLATTNSILNTAPPPAGAARRHLGMAVEHLVAAALDDAPPVDRHGDSRHRDGLFSAAQLTIEESFRDPSFDLTRLAKELSVSMRTLHSTFSRLGTTPRREVERRRVEEARRLAEDLGLRGSELAERAGFSSTKRLSRALTRTAGTLAHTLPDASSSAAS
ncbi:MULTISPECIES: helix-turn-helix domain-containing protein [Bacteria]|uniref:helix-turn-helix domain-containing protein n=1 Tax=Bacteria TaxID=2 RepID=UPI003C7D92DB